MRSFMLVSVCGQLAAAFNIIERPWMSDPTMPPAERAAALVAAMSVDDKVSLCHGVSGPYVGQVIVANKSLGIPPIQMNDGPQGFRAVGHAGTSTAFPSGLAIGASWDAGAAAQWGAAMGVEFAAKGANVQLGPAMCVARVPRNGRNFEYMSGEDPVLGAKLVGPAISAIQAQGVVANAKHWVMNNQESNRMTISEDVDERTRHEMYYPPFAAAVRAGVGSFMCSYNKINGKYSCENPETLKHDLKEVLNFTNGWVMSDWGATHSMSINEGLDQEMAGTIKPWMKGKLAAAVADGTVTMATLDETARRVLTPLFAVGEFDNPVSATGSITANVTSTLHNAIARNLSIASTVLLKNANGTLPINLDTGGRAGDAVRRIAVIGKAADAAVIAAGGGSGHVDGPYTVSVLQGIRSHIASLGRLHGVSTRATSGATCSFENGTDYYQLFVPSIAASSAAECCSLCAAKSDCTFFSFSAKKKTCWFKTSDAGRKADADITSGSPLAPGAVIVDYVESDSAAAVAAARAADIAIVVGAASSSEGYDRKNLALDDGADELITAVARAAPGRTIVAMSTPGAVLTPWRDAAAAIVANFYPGQEGGNALADVLFGAANPTARLPLTFPTKENECPAFTKDMWPGVNLHANYSEGLLIGYRCYDAHQIEPAYPFGHGLSYTTFSYTNLEIDGTTVSVDVTNTGNLAGGDVVQLYLGFPVSAGEPPKQLKGFEKVQLAPGAKTTVQFKLEPQDLSVWDVATHNWSVVKGTFDVYVGASSRDPGMLSGSLTNN